MPSSRHADLVTSRLRYVPHPRQCLVPRLFNYLEVPHLQARHRKVWQLKLDLNWRSPLSCPRVLLRCDGRLRKFRAEHVLSPTREALDFPHQSVTFWDVGTRALGHFEHRRNRVGGQRHRDFHARSGVPLAELCARLDEVFRSAAPRPFGQTLNPYERFHVVA